MESFISYPTWKLEFTNKFFNLPWNLSPYSRLHMFRYNGMVYSEPNGEPILSHCLTLQYFTERLETLRRYDVWWNFASVSHATKAVTLHPINNYNCLKTWTTPIWFHKALIKVLIIIVSLGIRAWMVHNKPIQFFWRFRNCQRFEEQLIMLKIRKTKRFIGERS